MAVYRCRLLTCAQTPLIRFVVDRLYNLSQSNQWSLGIRELAAAVSLKRSVVLPCSSAHRGVINGRPLKCLCRKPPCLSVLCRHLTALLLIELGTAAVTIAPTCIHCCRGFDVPAAPHRTAVRIFVTISATDLFAGSIEYRL